MGNPKLSTFLIPMVWMSFLIIVFAGFISNLTNNYNIEFDESQLGTLDKMETLNDNIETYQKGTDIQEPSSLVDRIGGYFSQAYQNMRTITGSVDVFKSMTNDAFASSSMNIPFSNSLKSAIILTVIILIFTGTLLSAIVKWRL